MRLGLEYGAVVGEIAGSWSAGGRRLGTVGRKSALGKLQLMGAFTALGFDLSEVFDTMFRTCVDTSFEIC